MTLCWIFRQRHVLLWQPLGNFVFCAAVPPFFMVVENPLVYLLSLLSSSLRARSWAVQFFSLSPIQHQVISPSRSLLSSFLCCFLYFPMLVDDVGSFLFHLFKIKYRRILWWWCIFIIIVLTPSVCWRWLVVVGIVSWWIRLALLSPWSSIIVFFWVAFMWQFSAYWADHVLSTIRTLCSRRKHQNDEILILRWERDKRPNCVCLLQFPAATKKG